jgi:uncharacterized membrane protein
MIPKPSSTRISSPAFGRDIPAAVIEAAVAIVAAIANVRIIS